MKLKASILGLLLLSCLFMIDCAPAPTTTWSNGGELYLKYRDSDTVEVTTYVPPTTTNCKICVGVDIPTRDSINSGEFEDVCSNGKKYNKYTVSSETTFSQAAFINSKLNGDPSQLSENNYSGEIWCRSTDDIYIRGITRRLTYNGGAAGGGGGGGTPPFDPTSLIANPIATQVNLTWLDNATDETSYKIERADDDGFGNPILYGQINSIGANMTAYSDTTGVSTTVYWYRVRASNGAGHSSYSNEVSVTYP